MPSKEAVLNKLFHRVEVVNDCVGVCVVTGSENDEFELLRQRFEEISGVRSDVDGCDSGGTSWEFDSEGHLVRFSWFFEAVHEGLI